MITPEHVRALATIGKAREALLALLKRTSKLVQEEWGDPTDEGHLDKRGYFGQKLVRIPAAKARVDGTPKRASSGASTTAAASSLVSTFPSGGALPM